MSTHKSVIKLNSKNWMNSLNQVTKSDYYKVGVPFFDHKYDYRQNTLINTYLAQISIWIYSDAPYKLQTHPTQPRGGHPSHVVISCVGN